LSGNQGAALDFLGSGGDVDLFDGRIEGNATGAQIGASIGYDLRRLMRRVVYSGNGERVAGLFE
jgi:hypothetical protein